jgi:sugar O-acyltransferase (sialic acid O-acetyltransferase NeuD family)
MYLYGAGGHAKVILDILKSNDISVSEIFDDDPAIESFMGIPVSHKGIRSPLIISIGNNRIRKTLAEKINQMDCFVVPPCDNGAFSPALYDKTAIISDSATIEKGTVVMQGAIVQSSAKIGKHCIINTKASIDHDCIIEDYVHIAPGAVLCGNVKIGEGSLIGAGTTIIPGITIGKWAVIGAGSVVRHNIPDNVIAYGSPCKIKQ